jgi:hypothetical protein
MCLYCSLDDLKNESDVEQKLVWPLLASPVPGGLGFAPPEIYTKTNIRYLEIEKGTSKKVYRPDYILLIAGLPLVTIEAKHPDEEVEEGLREARLYAAELNAQYPGGINPCFRVIATNGQEIISSPWDTAAVDFRMQFNDINQSSHLFHDLLGLVGRDHLQQVADAVRRVMRTADYHRATHLLGGKTARNDEVGYNEFGVRLSIDFLHIFNPQTRQDRAEVVRNAYVPSKRREHYTDEIDRVIRTAIPSTLTGGSVIEDTSNPSELLRLMGRAKDLQNKLFLLVGAVGAGKSTFVDYFREVKLNDAVRSTTVWITVDMNGSPSGKEMLETWVVDQLISGLLAAHPTEKLGEYEALLKVFGVEMHTLKQGPLKMLSQTSDLYQESVAKELMKLTSDRVNHAKALARYLCSERGKVMVVVMDNSDKGDLQEQLTVFQIVRWVQSWLKCIVFLPIRDVTYHAYRNQPPLDTVIKDFVFRIEAPPFGRVLRERIRMALAQAAVTYGGDTLSYSLESGVQVVYPPTEVGYYLACIYRSLFEHDRLLRRMLVGLAGNNIRKAMEIFLDFCKSGHIGGKEFLQIRVAQGNYALPYKIVTRVLLRLNRRFYDGDESHLKNLYQCHPSDARPDHFVRLAILRWLAAKFSEKGPTGVKAFHRTDRLIADLLPHGHDAQRIREELHYLIQAMSVLTEHQRTECLTDDDLICLSPAGFAHLEMVGNFDYLAACSEDTFVAKRELAQRVADRIGQHGVIFHYARETTRTNALEFCDYLVEEARREVSNPSTYLANRYEPTIHVITNVQSEVQRRTKEELEKERQRWEEVEKRFFVNGVYPGQVHGVKEFGVFVTLARGIRGLLHVSKLVRRTVESYRPGEEVQVRVLAINVEERKISLGLGE